MRRNYVPVKRSIAFELCGATTIRYVQARSREEGIWMITGTLEKLSFHEQTSGNSGARRSLGGSVACNLRRGIAQLIEHGSGRAYLLLLIFPVVFCIPPTTATFRTKHPLALHASQVVSPLPAQACATTCQGCTYSIPGYYRSMLHCSPSISRLSAAARPHPNGRDGGSPPLRSGSSGEV